LGCLAGRLLIPGFFLLQNNPPAVGGRGGVEGAHHCPQQISRGFVAPPVRSPASLSARPVTDPNGVVS
jgi:hypothetical protein